MPTPQVLTDASYIDEALNVLAVRARRLALARECRHAQQGGPDDQPCQSALDRLTALDAREKGLKAELDARLDAHRADPSAQQLGLHRLGMTLDLNEEEMMVLVTAFCFALSEDMASFVFDDMASGFGGSGSVEFYCRLLQGDSTADRLRVRRYFLPTGRLVAAGLIAIDKMRNADFQPEDLLWCRVRLTDLGFGALVGVGPVPTMVEPCS